MSLRAPGPGGTGGCGIVEPGRAEEIAGRIEEVWKLTYEIEGAQKPACVAEIVFRYVAA